MNAFKFQHNKIKKQHYGKETNDNADATEAKAEEVSIIQSFRGR